MLNYPFFVFFCFCFQVAIVTVIKMPCQAVVPSTEVVMETRAVILEVEAVLGEVVTLTEVLPTREGMGAGTSRSRMVPGTNKTTA